jgi:hypothetical protein
MSQYKIFRWDGILSNNGINKQPIIYIMPDMDFLEFAKNNSYVLNVEINGTNTIYDGKNLLGSVNTSSFMPNFSAQTNLMVIVLECIWYGLPNPDSLGTATFYGIHE